MEECVLVFVLLCNRFALLLIDSDDREDIEQVFRDRFRAWVEARNERRREDDGAIVSLNQIYELSGTLHLQTTDVIVGLEIG